jgi:putative transposase
MTYYARNLPHWHPSGHLLFVTWRLYGSLPASAVAKIKSKHRASAGRRFASFDSYLDKSACGPLWLRQPEIAEVVVASLRHGHELCHYILHAFVIMPNHVHLLMNPLTELSRCMRGIKNPTARAANRLLERTGRPFWQDESFDHWVRNGAQLERITRYIEHNPVQAGLVKGAEDWPWSSAYGRSRE